MSTDVLSIIPADPNFVPDDIARERAKTLFASLVPGAQEVKASVSQHVAFVDQGENFDRVYCPSCGVDVGVPWWQKSMGEAYRTKFANLSVTLPCCGAASSLNDLRYDLPAGFARFTLQATEPQNDIDDQDIRSLEKILGTPLRKIWAHY